MDEQVQVLLGAAIDQRNEMANRCLEYLGQMAVLRKQLVAAQKELEEYKAASSAAAVPAE